MFKELKRYTVGAFLRKRLEGLEEKYLAYTKGLKAPIEQFFDTKNRRKEELDTIVEAKKSFLKKNPEVQEYINCEARHTYLIGECLKELVLLPEGNKMEIPVEVSLEFDYLNNKMESIYKTSQDKINNLAELDNKIYRVEYNYKQHKSSCDNIINNTRPILEKSIKIHNALLEMEEDYTPNIFGFTVINNSNMIDSLAVDISPFSDNEENEIKRKSKIKNIEDYFTTSRHSRKKQEWVEKEDGRENKVIDIREILKERSIENKAKDIVETSTKEEEPIKE